jgi:hypothetical protein
VDGIDSNGIITLTGGDIDITSADNGGDSPLDANGDITLDGATVVANGEEITSVDDLDTGMGGGDMGGGPGGDRGGAPGEDAAATGSTTTDTTTTDS